jgi:hypothetical protein
MNEHNQIVSIHFVRSGDMKEVETILNRIHRLYCLHGYEEVCLFYNDNCCQEYKMLTKAIPSLAKFDEQFTVATDHTENLKLPALYKVRAINFDATFVPIGLALLERLNACAAISKVVIGFDVEWDALTYWREVRNKETRVRCNQ